MPTACAPHGTCCANATLRKTADPSLRARDAEAKRRGTSTPGTTNRFVSRAADYPLPDGIIGLTGPVAKPAPGALPLRGDLAHVALAGRYLAAHYVVPQCRTVAERGATLYLAPRSDAEKGETLAPGAMIELLDVSGDWAWVCRGPEGPSGYVPLERLIGDA